MGGDCGERVIQDKPKFMSAKWQSKLMGERPALFWLLSAALAFPFLYLLRLGMNGEFGGAAQTGLRLIAACLAVALIWFLIAHRARRKERETMIDSYLERRHDQTHRQDPPSA
jgi:hypothetical protein